MYFVSTLANYQPCTVSTWSADDGASTLALTPMGGVNWSPKQRVTVAPQNGFKTHGQSQPKSKTENTSGSKSGDLSPKIFLKK